MASNFLICVGKLKSKEFEALEAQYLKRINNPKLEIIEVKANAENKEVEAQSVLKKINDLSKSPQIILLSEWGEEFNSAEFNKWLEEKTGDLFFVIAGAEGHGEALLNAKHEKLSLSKLTMPHRMARLVFVEQLYRAQTIRTNHPYHN